MEIISRKDAISRSLNKYFTGETCKNGHLAERYVQSGSCEMCIRASSPFPHPSHERNSEIVTVRQQRADIEAGKLKLRQERLELDKRKADLSAQRLALRPRAKREDLIDYNAMLHFDDVLYFKSFMLAMAMGVDVTVTADDLTTRRSPMVQGEQAIHYFKAFQSTKDALRAEENRLLRERPDRQREEEMARRHTEAARAIDEQDNGRPEVLEGLTSN